MQGNKISSHLRFLTNFCLNGTFMHLILRPTSKGVRALDFFVCLFSFLFLKVNETRDISQGWERIIEL